MDRSGGGEAEEEAAASAPFKPNSITDFTNSPIKRSDSFVRTYEHERKMQQRLDEPDKEDDIMV